MKDTRRNRRRKKGELREDVGVIDWEGGLMVRGGDSQGSGGMEREWSRDRDGEEGE